MTRKHFKAIAEAIRNNINNREQDREAFARALLPALRASNPNFDTGRFLDGAVGLRCTTGITTN
jgi:hypothetical protein